MLAIAEQDLILVLVIEQLENGFLILLINARAFVIDDEDDLLLGPIIGQVDVHFPIMAVFDRILNDIYTYLLNSVWVSNRALW